MMETVKIMWLVFGSSSCDQGGTITSGKCHDGKGLLGGTGGGTGGTGGGWIDKKLHDCFWNFTWSNDG
jgi:hypothetical protein